MLSRFHFLKKKNRVRPFVFLMGRATVFSNRLKLEINQTIEGVYFLGR